ncbi:hypothetical protein [Mesorhizobium sp. M0909]|uniref:hypothetical protein n=1 Tax=Mesorhizobium sp. M0909 TaxID=2957024 RepID=UPI003339CD65
MIAAAESSGCAAPDTGDVVVVDRPVADVDPKLGQFAVSFTAIPQCPPSSHRRFYQAVTAALYQAVTAALVVGSSTKSDMRHTAITAMSLL